MDRLRILNEKGDFRIKSQWTESKVLHCLKSEERYDKQDGYTKDKLEE
jgi:hypothetical protein